MLIDVKDEKSTPLVNTIEPIFDKPDSFLCHDANASDNWAVEKIKTIVVRQEDLCNKNSELHYMVVLHKDGSVDFYCNF